VSGLQGIAIYVTTVWKLDDESLDELDGAVIDRYSLPAAFGPRAWHDPAVNAVSHCAEPAMATPSAAVFS